MEELSETASHDPAELGRAVARAAARLAAEQWEGARQPEPARVAIELEVGVGLRPDPAELTELSEIPQPCYEVCFPQRGGPPKCHVVCPDPNGGGPGGDAEGPLIDRESYCGYLRNQFDGEESAVKRLLLLSMHRNGCLDLGDPQRVQLELKLPPG